MFGQNITKCIEGRCPYDQPECCYECDYRISSDCPDRCDQTSCRIDRVRERINRSTNAPHDGGMSVSA